MSINIDTEVFGWQLGLSLTGSEPATDAKPAILLGNLQASAWVSMPPLEKPVA